MRTMSHAAKILVSKEAKIEEEKNRGIKCKRRRRRRTAGRVTAL